MSDEHSNCRRSVNRLCEQLHQMDEKLDEMTKERDEWRSLALMPGRKP